jgi:hypothetical protein
MKALIAGCILSVVTLAVLAVGYLDHLGRLSLGVPAGTTSAVALAVFGINLGAAALAVAYRRRGPAVAWTVLALALGQVAAVLVAA